MPHEFDPVDAIEKIKEMEEIVQPLMRVGALDPMVFRYAEIYRNFERMCLVHKGTKGRRLAMSATAKKFNCSQRTVYRVISRFK